LEWVGEMSVSKLSAGFCNAVYKVEVDVPSNIVPLEEARGGVEDSIEHGQIHYVDKIKLGISSEKECASSTIKRVFVAKYFSKLAKLRQMEHERGVIDVHTASMGLSPKVVVSTPDIIIHEYYHGRELGEDDLVERSCDVVVSPFVLGEQIASKLVAYHTMKWPKEFNTTTPVLWLNMERMLNQIAQK
jgi:hypothetical protein